MKPEEIAQWVIDNRYPKSELDKVSDVEMYHNIIDMINRKPVERILCAATWFDDGKKYHFQPKNIDSGLVICGHRHCCIFQTIGGTVGERQKLGIYEKEQGFLTNTNRFVGRQEALFIARESNQVLDESEVRTHIGLHSEDLY